MEAIGSDLQFLQGTDLLAMLIASLDDGVLVMDRAGTIRIYGRQCETLLGFSAREATGQPVSFLFPSERAAVIENILTGKADAKIETAGRRKDGTYVPLSLSLAPIRDSEGRIAGAFAKLAPIDAAAREQAAREFAGANRKSAVSEMSVAIAHELNQPLTAVTNYVKAAQRFLGGESPSSKQIHSAREAMEKAAEQVVRAAGIIRHVRDFLEEREGEKRYEDINQVIREAVALSLAGRPEIQVKLDLETNIPQLLLDRVQIREMFLNLIRNAVEAMAQSENREIRISSSRTDAGLEVLIRDTGPGFSPQMPGKLFQAFATTKRGAMGIGLKICQSVVQNHGGAITALPEGPGAALLIRLPLA